MLVFINDVDVADGESDYNEVKNSTDYTPEL